MLSYINQNHELKCITGRVLSPPPDP
jgi:hypothetical protein